MKKINLFLLIEFFSLFMVSVTTKASWYDPMLKVRLGLDCDKTDSLSSSSALGVIFDGDLENWIRGKLENNRQYSQK